MNYSRRALKKIIANSILANNSSLLGARVRAGERERGERENGRGNWCQQTRQT
ncbi:hypothetical protein IQ270_11620 [Microcoleus sp. LEGE 07076]|uniref:hypothetical protein n=1 Tax=Microcoleus sp. LEGE 07076 TaxID=915322 RepID=UPI0018803D5E|nr:hypothetical protein [Microcoleus sp. LEGE 07076]MBE9185340.1 hypothetical protein [Microcoleus sp. LEGE 07076]